MRLSLRAKINLYVSLSIIGITVLSSFAFFLKYRGELDTNITARLTIGAHLAKECIDMGLVSHLRDEGFRDSEPNLKTLSKLKTLEKNFGFSSVYLCVRENAKTIFAFDSGDYQSTEDLSFLSDYEEAPPQLGEAFISGKDTSAEYSDRWGPTRTVFVPVKDSSGNVTGVIGADFSVSDVRTVLRKAYLLLAAVILAGILLSLLVIWLLRLSFTGPILRIIRDISSISEDMDLSRRTPVRGSDELGLLAKKFNAFLQQSAENVSHIEETSAILALSPNELSEISTVFTSTTQLQAESTAEAVETIARITTLINRIVSLSGQQLEIFSSQRQLIGDLHAGINAVNGQAERAMSLSANVSTHAKEGEESLSTMNRSMDKVMKSSEDMIGIIGIINDISDRINLLSLNAAIEAARAGEAGRGFAVVADEVSKLADQTASSTKNIDSLIRANSEEIAREIESLNATTSILREIIGGVENMRGEIQTIQGSTREQLENAEMVRQNAGNIFARAEEIKSSADEQKRELDSITGSINEMENNMRGVICGSEEIAANSHDIADTAKTLKQNISVFKF